MRVKLRGLGGLTCVGLLSVLAGCSTCSTCGKGNSQASNVRPMSNANGPALTSGMAPRGGTNPVMATSQSQQQGYTRTTLPMNAMPSGNVAGQSAAATTGQVQPAGGMVSPTTVDLPPVTPPTPPAGSPDMSLVPPAPNTAAPSAPITLPGQN